MTEQEMLERIIVIDILTDELYDEQEHLNQYLKTMYIEEMLSNHVLATWGWKVDSFNVKTGRGCLIACVPAYPKSLKKFSRWEYPHLNIREDIGLGWYYGVPYLDGPMDQLRFFVKEQGITVDYTTMLVPYKKLLDEVATMQEHLRILGVKYEDTDKQA